MSYAIGVNRIGTDANGYEYIGVTQAVDYRSIMYKNHKIEGFFTVKLDQKNVETETEIGFLNDQKFI
jgi:predicted GIY-YIG superfamily endonuclease